MAYCCCLVVLAASIQSVLFPATVVRSLPAGGGVALSQNCGKKIVLARALKLRMLLSLVLVTLATWTVT